MQPKKPNKDRFNDAADAEGTLLIKNGPQSSRLIKAADIRSMTHSNGNVYFHLPNENVVARTNFDIAIEAYLRARNYGETVDLRGVCFLPENDKHHKFYTDENMPDVVKDELRQRVATIAAKPF